MMKKPWYRSSFLTWGAILWLALLAAGCNAPNQSETFVEGRIGQAGALQVYLDRIVIGKPGVELARAYPSADGSFRLVPGEMLDPGVYQLRVGAYRIPLIVNEPSNRIQVHTTLGALAQQEVRVQGAPATRAYYEFLQAKPNPFPDEVGTFVDTTRYPYAAAWLTFSLWRNRIDLLDLHRKAQEKLAKAYPDSEMNQQYVNYIESRKREHDKIMSERRIQVGKPAPDITLPTPAGKEISLSDLEGKIVLLDFWASWCGPCRRENPNVVRVYEQYKDRGFTVFSVSLDGLDSNARARLGSSEKVNKALEQQKAKWVGAIRKDQLSWDNHVSDLKAWESEAAAIYGVSAIPQTYLIDREGKIAVIGLRGAEQLRRELEKRL